MYVHITRIKSGAPSICKYGPQVPGIIKKKKQEQWSPSHFTLQSNRTGPTCTFPFVHSLPQCACATTASNYSLSDTLTDTDTPTNTSFTHAYMLYVHRTFTVRKHFSWHGAVLVVFSMKLQRITRHPKYNQCKKKACGLFIGNL